MGVNDSAMSSAKDSGGHLHSVISDDFITLVGAVNVRPSTASDQVAGIHPKFVVEPGSEKELAAVLQAANEMGLAVIPRGGGTKMNWGNAPLRGDVILSTARLNSIIEHVWADLTVTVEAGCTIAKLQRSLAQHGQRLALDALWPAQATIGGVLSTNESGALRLRFGALRDLIIGVTVALPSGTLASSGGKVVKNVAGYDLPKLVTGAYGTLGVITRAVFRLHPLARNARSFSMRAGSLDEAQRLILSVQDSKLAHTALQARLGAVTPPNVDIFFESTEAGLAAQEYHLRALVQPTTVDEAPFAIWNSRQSLWDASEASAIAKLSILPDDLAKTIQMLESTAIARNISWKAVVQATGIGWLRMDGEPQVLQSALNDVRAFMEGGGGSLVVVHRPTIIDRLDAWGNAGDALPLMRAVKKQLDPSGTLNPGRFVGGI